MAQECMIHFVGFDRTTLKNLREKAAPIRLNNCAIQKNKLSGKLEITLKGYTVVEKSSTTFQVENLATLGSLRDIHSYDKVTVRIKVLRILAQSRISCQRKNEKNKRCMLLMQ